jgi:hypothetical protein
VHRFACFRVLAVGQAERLAAQTQFRRKSARQCFPLRAILLLDRNRSEPVPLNQYSRVDVAFEFPIVGDERVSGRVGERRRWRIARLPHLDLTIANSEAYEEYVGARAGRVDVGSALGQIALRESLDVPIDDGPDTEVEEFVQRFLFSGHNCEPAVSKKRIMRRA